MDWEYIELDPNYGSVFAPRDNGLFELILLVRISTPQSTFHPPYL